MTSSARRVLVALAMNYRSCKSDAARVLAYAKHGPWDAVVTVNESAGLSQPSENLFHIECNFKSKRGTSRLVDMLGQMFPKARQFDVRLDCVCLVPTYYRSNYGLDWVSHKLAALIKHLPGCTVALPEDKHASVASMLAKHACSVNVSKLSNAEGANQLLFLKLACLPKVTKALNKDGKLAMPQQMQQYVKGYYVFS